MRKIRSTLFLIVFIGLFSLFLTGISNTFAQPLSDDIVVEVNGGFDGISKLGAWSPVTVKICSKNRNISGEIEVETNLDQARKVLVSKPVELLAGVEQEIYFEIPVVSAKKGVNIRLVENKKTQFETTYSFKRLLPPEVMLIGVLSEDSEAFNYLNGSTVPVVSSRDYDEKLKLMIAAGEIAPSSASTIAVQDGSYVKNEAVVVGLNRDKFPDKTEIIEGFDFLIISKFDTSLLGKTQISTLEEWVDSGGFLIMGTGISYQKVYHGLPESLKPFTISGMEDVQMAETLKEFTGREASNMKLKIVKGELGFEYIPHYSGADTDQDRQYRFFDNDIIAGDEDNPLAIKYRKGNGTIVAFTFDPTVEPFTSWQSKVTFMENVFKYTGTGNQRFYEYNNGYFQKQGSSRPRIQNLATEVPYDKVPPFLLMFISLGIYLVLVGPVLYIVLKVIDKRDLAWILIPVLSVVFLAGMYLFGFKSRYNTAIVNTASLIEVNSETNEAYVSSAIGVFNNERGTLTIEYDKDNGVQTPFIERDNNYRYYGGETEGRVVGKYTIGDPVQFEQYDVMLWTPKMLYANKTLTFNGDIINGIKIKDSSLKGEIANTTPYDLLDAVVIIGNNIVPLGDIPADFTLPLDIPFDSDTIYKRPDEYLEAMYGRTYYNSPKEYPENFKELNKRRRMLEDTLNQTYNAHQGEATLTLLARNEQEIDYGLIVNNKKPQKYNQNLILMESGLPFETGQEIEIPGGIILPSMYQEKDTAWQQGDNSIGIQSTGDVEFEFVLPHNLAVNEIRLYVENYIPINVKYRMSQNSPTQIGILQNKYEYFLYNVKTRSWVKMDFNDTDEFNFDAIIKDDVTPYIGLGNEVRMMIRVIELGNPGDEVGAYKDYYEGYLSMPEIFLKGVAK